MNVTVISEDGVEPITLNEAKDQCYILRTDTDTTLEALLNSLIEATRQYAEDVTWRTLKDKTLELRMDEFPSGITGGSDGKINRNIIELPNPPLISVDSIKYIINDTETTLSSDEYTVDTNSTPGRIEPDDFWPNTDDVIDAVRIRYKAGYEDNDSNESQVPEVLKIAMKMHIKYLYDNRDAVALLERSGEYVTAPMGTDAILRSHSVEKFV